LKDIEKMMTWTQAAAEKLGAKTTLLPNPASTAERPLPPILLGEFLVDPQKKTLCVYGHLDVQPASQDDGWNTDPFVLTEQHGKLYGRGSTDDKGPALSWLWVVEAHQEMGVELPVNLKILYEGMEEYGSEGLFECIAAEAKEGKFLSDVVSTKLLYKQIEMFFRHGFALIHLNGFMLSSRISFALPTITGLERPNLV
jgi:acetylornithine deacetylase/succinyl-diaminopimelate desuccinylase-like protein